MRSAVLALFIGGVAATFIGGVAATFISAVAATPALAAQQRNCVDVKVGTARSYDCVNQQLGAVAKEAHQGNATLQAAPYDANSPANQTGQFDEQATHERLGTNFGKSVTPQRPAANFGNAFAPPH